MIIILAIIGFILSTYLLIVKIKAGKAQDYLALCDFRHNVSCSRVVTSKYANLFGASNVVIGMIFYALIILAQILDYNIIIVIVSGMSVLVSIYLSYLLYKLKNVCVVCVATYLINIAIFVLSITV